MKRQVLSLLGRGLILLMMIGSAAMAADLPGFALYRISDLRQYATSLAPKVDPTKKSASAPLGKFGNHYALIAHREGPGQAEIHQRMADLFVVESGEAILVVGGRADNVKEVEPGELLGTSITGGQRRELRAGDIVHIPAGMPHQLLIDAGKQFTYFVLKVQEN